MKIIILGAGQVGGTLAENLVGEKNEITVIDSDPVTLRALQDRLDLQVVNGVGSHPDVLRKAGMQLGMLWIFGFVHFAAGPIPSSHGVYRRTEELGDAVPRTALLVPTALV